MKVPMTDRPRPHHPALAALLSFLFPGLGQAYAGQPLLAAVFAAPALLIVIGAVAVATLFAGRLRNDLLSSSFLIGALLLDLALMAWRLASIGHVGLGIGSGPVRPSVHPRATRTRHAGSLAVVAALLVTTIAMHAWAGLVITRIDSTLADVFVGGISSPGGGGPLNRPEFRWDGTQRVTFLLLGIDSGVGRSEALTDTILAVSIDPVAGTAVMVSVPRDTGFVPLPDRSVYADGVYPNKINQLSTDAGKDPTLWCPDLPSSTTDCGLRTLERAIGLYLGIPIQYYATVDLQGFADLIDAVGGVRLCLPGKLVDSEYSGPTWRGIGITLPAGCTQYDGPHALAYSRIRKGYLELPDGTQEPQNDFKRADRQQQVLLQLRSKFAEANLVFALPSILQAVARTVNTDFPRARAGDLASLLPLITGPHIKRVVLGYPGYVDLPLNPATNYLLIPRRGAVRTEMQGLFGTGLQGWYLAGASDGPPS
jgi:polyisoprenyl-teichoic acid--peptidoglycan teichoic acid transferase